LTTALLTGGNGNLGRLVANRLRARGVAVIKFDLPGTEKPEEQDTVILGDIRDGEALDRIVAEQKPDVIYHLASLLSGSSEADLAASWAINATASFNLLQSAMQHGVERFFFASTVATHGPDLGDPLPLDAPQWPENFYGATKVAVERLGVYFKQKHGLDFRCLRFPLVISPFAPPSAVTAYPSHALRAAYEGQPFTFPVSPGTGMSTLYLDDVIRSIEEYSFAEKSALTRHAYNLHGYFASAETVVETIQKRYPAFQFDYQPMPDVEALLDGWPDTMDDQPASDDWGWKPAYDFADSADAMFELLKQESPYPNNRG
jgi:threonine 3-dehydrogenase